MTNRPPLSTLGHVTVVTYFPPHSSGSSVLMKNLLSYFNPTSFTVATINTNSSKQIDTNPEIVPVSIVDSLRFSSRLNYYWEDLQIPIATKRLISIVKANKTRLIVAVHPTYALLDISARAAHYTDLPWIAYLHDTIVEALAHHPKLRAAQRVQERVFREASSILVMSQGMSDLFRVKYNLEVSPLVHSYPEPIRDLPAADRTLHQAFWGGAVYDINGRSMGRISRALAKVGLLLMLSGHNSEKTLMSYGVTGDHIRHGFQGNRPEYLKLLTRQDILLLALDWDDESTIHVDELSTIFPTKAIEYLASGRPILVHCPESYFLARFFREKNCGMVVTERSVEALETALQQLLNGVPEVDVMIKNALKTSHQFALEQVAQQFSSAIRDVLHP